MYMYVTLEMGGAIECQVSNSRAGAYAQRSRSTVTDYVDGATSVELD